MEFAGALVIAIVLGFQLMTLNNTMKKANHELMAIKEQLRQSRP
ncbi:MAG: hypothetical protein P1R58_13045 [bacterium]|nr:hypothetical protein [bacterium]